MPLNDGAVSQIYPFAPNAQEGTGQLMPLDSYKEDSQRAGGMNSGIASRARFNRVHRQAAHMASGLAQFIANRHAPGVLDDADLDKIEAGLLESVRASATDAMLDYFLCWYVFKGLHPTAKPGMVPCNGALISGADALRPKAFAYLQTPAGQQLCITQAAYDTMRAAAPWNGIGGAPKFVLDAAAKTIRVPDLRGMYDEVAGYDSLGVGMSHGDAMREISGRLAGVGSSAASFIIQSITGAFGVQNYTSTPALTSMPGGQGQTQIAGNYGALFKASNVVPTASRFRPASWGALACVYLGLPS